MTERTAAAWLCLQIDLLEPRFHGTPEWPPSPARAFQALVSAAGRGRPLAPRDTAALEWLERLAPPLVGAPRAKRGKAANHYVPNNDIDAVGGVPSRVEKIRVSKPAHVRILDEGIPFFYLWEIEEVSEHVDSLRAIALHLHQFGRGVDAGHATISVLDEETFESIIENYDGHWLSPGPGQRSVGLKCPTSGSLQRLVDRFEASQSRLETVIEKKKTKQVFSQPPMVNFPEVRYGGRLQALPYDIVPSSGTSGQLTPWPLSRAHDLVVGLRDGMHSALCDALGANHRESLARTVIGRGDDATSHVPPEERIQLVPLPSIGHEHVSPQIRRILLLLPRKSDIPSEDLKWALERCELLGETPSRLVPAEDGSMAERYLQDAVRWQTTTPAALAAGRRRIDPDDVQAKGGSERRAEEAAAISGVRDALRHAGVRERPVDVRVQREPFGVKGLRAERFAEGTRFSKESLWHVSLTFATPISGPLVLGNGRFLGLGVMHPVEPFHPRLLAFQIKDGLRMRDAGGAVAVARALRRAVMARAQHEYGNRPLPARISGHRSDGAPSTDPHKLAYTCDLERNILLVASTAPTTDRSADQLFAHLQQALSGFETLRAAQAGELTLAPLSLVSCDPLLRPSRVWSSRTPYEVERYRQVGDAEEAVRLDVEQACKRCGLPRPVVAVESFDRRDPTRLSAFVRLTFETAIGGPLFLGRSRYKGGGLLAGTEA